MLCLCCKICMVVISLDAPSCRVCLFDPRTSGCIGTLPDRPRIVPFEVHLSRCCLYGDGQRTWAGIIQVNLPQSQCHEFRLGGYERGYRMARAVGNCKSEFDGGQKDKNHRSYWMGLYGLWWQSREYLEEQRMVFYSGKVFVNIFPWVFDSSI